MSQIQQWLIEQGEQPAFDWNRLAPQNGFITTTEKFSMYSGGFGSGKTAALCCKIITLMTLVPGNLGMLARQDGKALKQTTLLNLLEMIPKQWIATHDAQKGMLRLTPEMGGSILVYGDLKDTGDLKNHNLGFFAVDQAEEMEWESWEFLTGRLRRKNPLLDPETQLRQYFVRGECATGQRHFSIGLGTKCSLCGATLPEYEECLDDEEADPAWDLIIYPRFGFGVCNTEDPSHWIFQKFNGLPGPDGGLSTGIEGYEAYHSTTYDALKAGFVDKDYVKDLERTYQYKPELSRYDKDQPLMYKRYLLGSWIVAEGLIFPEYGKETHVYHDDQIRYDGQPLLPHHADVFEYIDPGITAATAIGWVVVEHCKCGCERPNYYLIDEHYVESKVVEYHCDQIHQHRDEIGRHVVSTEMDSAAFSQSNLQKVNEMNENRVYSIAQLYIDQKVYARRNQKDWDSGYQRFTSALAKDPRHRHPVTGKFGGPHFMVSSRCKWFQWEISKYKWKVRKTDKHTTEEPVDRDDHHMDGIISFMAGRPEHRVVEPTPIDTRPSFIKDIEEELEELTGVGSSTDFMEM